MKKHGIKTTMRAVSAALCAVLLGWYASPGVYRVLHLPDCVAPDTALSAPALSAERTDAQFVRESGDERLRDAANTTVTLSLFGVIPVRTFTVQTPTKTVAAGGQAVGVVLKTSGVQIVGFEPIDTADGALCPAAEAGLTEGDMIVSLNGEEITDAASLSRLCAAADGACILSCRRDGAPFSVSVTPAVDRFGEKHLGVWVRDSTSGIGTLSFYDPDTGAFAALGHGVNDVDTQKLIAPATGFLTPAQIVRVRKGGGKTAGELVGRFSTEQADAIATVSRNTVFGISGTLTAQPASERRLYEIAPCKAAHKGDAYILSTVDGEVAAYAVRVIRVDMQSSPDTQGMMIEITDPDLLRKTGGIVQGMSGSPLIQDGRLIGVVTHVFLNDPARGYCLYAEWMEQELFDA